MIRSLVRAIRQRLQQRWQSWAQQRQTPGDSVRLTQRNVYILPTGAGLLLALTCMVLLLAAINYQLNLGYLLTFLVAGSALASVPLAHRTLRGLAMVSIAPQAVCAGASAKWDVQLLNTARYPRLSIGVVLAGDGEWTWLDVPAQGQATVQLTVRAQSRGWQQVPALVVETRFPLGLFRVWTVWRPSTRMLVYPQPEDQAPPLPAPQSGDTGDGASRRGTVGEFDGVRAYRRGDPLKHIVWKKMARTDQPVSREFQQARLEPLWLDLVAAGAAGNREAQLSRLCAWVLRCEHMGVEYGLRLPGAELDPMMGAAHQHRCLQALALC